ncbi:MAG: glycosyltransferase [Thermomicrobiales bacterium]|nr:glycosyltransferase [Thermomicrobiales bacterium]
MTHRIAMISEHASPVALLGGVDAGGQNVYVDAVSRGVAALGYAADVFTVHTDPALPHVIDWADGVRVINVPAGPASARAKDALWPHMPAFRDGIDRFRRAQGQPYDLIHGNFWMSGWVAAELGRRWSAPVAQIFHATGVTKLREQGAADTSPGERIAVERAVVRAVDRLIAQCPAERDELLDDYDARPERIALIPSAVDIARYRPVPQAEARQRLGIDPAAEVIVYVGRVVPRKDVRNVVQALARLKRARLASGASAIPTLIVVGGETEQPDPEATPEIGVLQALAADLGVAGDVHFVGRHQADELYRWYSAADVAVTTPWYEPFGLTPLEAMACGTPVVGSSVGGISFTIADGETGLLVPPRDPEALAAALERLLGDSGFRERMGRAGRARVMRSFTWQQVAKHTAALYDDLLGQHRPSAEPHRHGPLVALPATIAERRISGVAQ